MRISDWSSDVCSSDLRVGGHAVARASVIDDVALADAFGAHDLPLRVLAGGDDVAFRMYPLGVGQLVEGFTKNLAAGAAHIRALTGVLVVAWLTLLVQATVAPVRALLGGADIWTAAALYGVVAAQVWSMARKVGRFGTPQALSFPPPLAVLPTPAARPVGTQ